eukprot:s141_g13.t1
MVAFVVQQSTGTSLAALVATRFEDLFSRSKGDFPGLGCPGCPHWVCMVCPRIADSTFQETNMNLENPQLIISEREDHGLPLRPGVATHRWGYACCLLCEKDSECGKVFALESGAGEFKAAEGAGENPVQSMSLPADNAEELPAEKLPRGTPKEDKAKPFEVLGLSTVKATSYAVRTAFRRLALLVHPDKNPGEEEKCHQALLRAQHAREAALALLSAPKAVPTQAGPSGTPGATPGDRGPTVRRQGPAPRPRDEAQVAREPQPRKDFASKEVYVSYALQFVLEEWQNFVDLALGGPGDPRHKKATEKRAVAAAASQGAEGVLRSQVAMQQTAKSVKALQKLLKNQELGADVLAKVERVCCGMLGREYTEANQASTESCGFWMSCGCWKWLLSTLVV